ncbi:ATP-binding protein [Micromonospora sp. NPDC049048]|uniref:ATP-binding protein n=1 Tax=Micromonospora sp. NPDC049048 TaxID=3364263 RepID=UPI0037203E91
MVAPPFASALVESLRGMGYGLPTAVADLVDNSVSARARHVRVEFSSDPGSGWVAVVDDGRGMPESVLHDAMRLGTAGPLAARATGDLGRFGLGLKTASFSQARRLTVVSRAGTDLACRTWDLDLVGRLDEWRLLDQLDGQAVRLAEDLGLTGSGTLVLWRDLDRVGEGPALVEAMGAVADHLGAVFGRYLAAGRLRLTVAGHEVPPWDPFLLHHAAAQDLGSEVLTLGGHATTVTPYVLPHPARLTESEYRRAAGLRGWHSQQGFYVYRGNRLLTQGGWLGLRGLTKHPQTRLARLAVDVDSDADHLWQVDVRKASVRSPSPLRARLTELATYARDRSELVFRHRGAPVSAPGRKLRALSFVWQQHSHHGKLGYRINREHPVVAAALQSSSGRTVEAVLRLVEQTVPVGLIAAEATSSPDRTPQASLDGVDPKEVRALLSSMVAGLPTDPTIRASAIRALSGSEPFNRFPEVLDEVLEGERGAD